MFAKSLSAAIPAALGLLATMVVFSSLFLSVRLVSGYVAIAIMYALVEQLIGKSAEKRRWALEYFILKQFFFGILWFVLWKYASPMTLIEWYANFERNTLGELSTGEGGQITMLLAIISAYLFMVDGGTKFVRGVLNKFPRLYEAVITKLNEEGGGEKEENVGEWIGVLERIIALTFVLTSSYTALAFALTAKSIARFKELEDKQFSEYYILGTSASLIVPLLAGVIIKVIFGF